jgi:hypothetical protein
MGGDRLRGTQLVWLDEGDSNEDGAADAPVRCYRFGPWMSSSPPGAGDSLPAMSTATSRTE